MSNPTHTFHPDPFFSFQLTSLVAQQQPSQFRWVPGVVRAYVSGRFVSELGDPGNETRSCVCMLMLKIFESLSQAVVLANQGNVILGLDEFLPSSATTGSCAMIGQNSRIQGWELYAHCLDHIIGLECCSIANTFALHPLHQERQILAASIISASGFRVYFNLLHILHIGLLPSFRRLR